ncbi:MAG: DUF1573 domain-containing protein [Bacteroidales bacterium]|nr:DUF1573 domain-containing protein [Bacteroidales bacterium]
MKKLIISLISVLVFVSYVNAQQKGANISFEKEIHDFGKIKEDGGKVEYKFAFTNTGNSPLIITKVKASCGCTSPTWTEKPVMPGQKGFVKAVFDPVRRPGNFNKSISVESNSEKGRNILRITGEVSAREKTIVDFYPKTMGELRLETNHMAFVRVYSTEIKTDTLKIINTSDSNMKITLTNVPDYLKLTTVPAVLKPGKKGYIIGEYNGATVNDWGFVTDRVKVYLNNKQAAEGAITISAKIEEDFSHLSETEILNAPKIVFEEKTFNFGESDYNEKVEYLFKFKNEGKSDLIIRKIRTTCGCTTVAPENKTIKPGASSSFKTIFNPGSRTGTQRKSIYVVTNDPKSSNVRLMITGKIKEK